MTLAASPVVGSVLKMAAGVLAGIGERKQKQNEYELQKWLQQSQQGRKTLVTMSTLNSKNPKDLSYALSTRRFIAILLTLTLCAVTLLWALYPDVQIITQNRGAGVREYFWGLYSTTFADPFTFVISTGDVVFGVLHLVGIIVGIYATPDRTGK